MKIFIECVTIKAKDTVLKFVEEDKNVTCVNDDPYIAEFNIKPKGIGVKLAKALTKIPPNMLIIAIAPWLDKNFPNLNYNIDYRVRVER